MVAYLARGLTAQMVRDIAGHFGRGPMRISQAIVEIEKRLRQDGLSEKWLETWRKD